MTVPSYLYKSQSIEQSITPPESPPREDVKRKVIHHWPEPDVGPEEEHISKRRRITRAVVEEAVEEFNMPHQEVLLLHAPKQRYMHTREQPIPSLDNDREMLVAVEVVGLNPIDWKAP